jgi:hypothetical protein
MLQGGNYSLIPAADGPSLTPGHLPLQTISGFLFAFYIAFQGVAALD